MAVIKIFCLFIFLEISLQSQQLIRFKNNYKKKVYRKTKIEHKRKRYYITDDLSRE